MDRRRRSFRGKGGGGVVKPNERRSQLEGKIKEREKT